MNGRKTTTVLDLEFDHEKHTYTCKCGKKNPMSNYQMEFGGSTICSCGVITEL